MPATPQAPDPGLLARLEQRTAKLEEHAAEALEMFRNCAADAGRIVLAAAIREELAELRLLRVALRDLAISAESVTAIWRDGYQAGRTDEKSDAEVRRRTPLQLVGNG